MMKKIITMAFIVISGEAIFMLPFLMPRLLRPLMLEAWNLTNTDFGLAFSAYGLSAMASYFIGGPLADKYSPRTLIPLSLVLTALGGAFLVMFPSRLTLILTYFYFGISTILLMWGALIKVTHIYGGPSHRSTAMGILDSGRGLFAAIISSVLLIILSSSLSETSNLIEKNHSLNLLIITTTLFTLLIAVAVWLTLGKSPIISIKSEKWTFQKAKLLLNNFDVWLLGVIVLCSYCGYKSIDNYSVYLVDIQKSSLVKASFFTSIIFWIRPISALICGYLTDLFSLKIKGGRFLVLAVLLSLGLISQLLLITNNFTSIKFILTTLLFSSAFFYAVRSIYFSVFDELKIENYLIGTAVGIVSVVGFLPDIFFGAITGYLIDSYPGETGFNYTFYFTASLLMIGAIASIISYKRTKI